MNKTATEPDQDLLQLLGAETQTGKRVKRAGWLAGALIIVVAIIYVVLHARPQNLAPQFEIETVQRGALRVAVSATGNLEPTNKVEVGSELSGLVEKVFVQENDHVKKGQVLARLDVSKLQDEITRSQASLASAEAKLAQAEATLEQDTATLNRQREVSRLSGGKVPSKTEMETAEATLARAQADKQSARADVNQAQAVLSTNQTNLAKASIQSPVDGVVLSRAVEPGQTVAATLQVATLFTVAEDLRQMELKVNVDEADVGTVREGQTATFTVDAYPNRKYSAKVTRVAYGSQTKDNVVSYSTVLKVKNDDLSLRPGMTATSEIETTNRENALLVPNAALRFTPPRTPAKSSGGLVGNLMPSPPRDRSTNSKTPTTGSSQQVWFLREGQPVAIPVTVGSTDGKYTEIVKGDLKEGMQVITDSTSTGK